MLNYCAFATISLNLRNFVMPSARYLSEHGYNVWVGCKYDEEFKQTLPPDIKYVGLDIERGFKLWKTIKTIFFLKRFFQKNDIHMIEYGTENVSFCASIAGWMVGIPVRIYNHWGSRYVGYSGLLRRVSLFIERTTSRFSTAIRDVSQRNMEICIEDKVYPAEKVKVLGYGGTVGVDFSRFSITEKKLFSSTLRERYEIGTDDFVFGDVGFIRRDKGSSELFMAFKKLSAENQRLWLMMVGDIYEEDPVDSHIMEWARQSDRVIFTGRVYDVERYMACFDCMVHPSYREGLGMVLQEAGAMGVPYITTDIPGPNEFGINGETGLLVKKGDINDLYEKMKYVIDNPDKRLLMSNAVYDLTKERYERGVMVERIFKDRNQLWNNR